MAKGGLLGGLFFAKKERPLVQQALATLGRTLYPHVCLSKSRIETLCLLIVGVVSARTVNLSHLASERQTTTKTRRPIAGFSGSFSMLISGPTGRPVLLSNCWALSLIHI